VSCTARWQIRSATADVPAPRAPGRCAGGPADCSGQSREPGLQGIFEADGDGGSHVRLVERWCKTVQHCEMDGSRVVLRFETSYQEEASFKGPLP
jgi:hypothetical protein